MATRTSGILLHVTSLPSSYGIGDLGPGAYAFVDFLERAGQAIWQVLPLGPTADEHSPYSSPSTFAGNPLLISPDLLAADGLLGKEDLESVPRLAGRRVDWPRVISSKHRLLDLAFERFRSAPGILAREEAAFARRQKHWLDDYVLFMALREQFGEGWTSWPEDIRQGEPKALAAARRELEREIEKRRFWQFLFDRQWGRLRDYCREKNIRLFGDVPIYVAHDSADVWSHPDLFHLAPDGQPKIVAGVPPDYFSETGQRWGNPIYDWRRMREDDFRWWRRRLKRTLQWVDCVRLDHFRGLEAYWEIPAAEETAVNGRWVKGPRGPLLEALEDELGSPLPMVAEDLGTITPDVRRLMERFGLPGMVVLAFGFGSDAENEYLPHNYHRHQVAYTGTHDNNTTVGWWEDDATGGEREMAMRYLGLEHSSEPIHRRAIREVMGSVAATAIFPLQDVLGLGSEARMNVPGREDGNWAWRCTRRDLSKKNAAYMRELAETYGRVGAGLRVRETMRARN